MQATLALRNAFEKALPTGFFAPADIPGLCDGAMLPERFCHVSNNDHGLKRILFDIEGATDFTLDGQGVRLVFLGETLPIRIGRSRHVTIRNLTIEWHRPFFTQGTITGSGTGWMSFATDTARYPLRVDRGRLVAHDGRGWQTDALWNLLAFHPGTREVCSRNENWNVGRWHRASDLGGGEFRIEADYTAPFETGHQVVLMHGDRVAPAVWIEDSAGVRLENVTIHHAPGMAVVGQLSRDVTLDHVRVVPSGDRLFSSWVDGIHLVDCEGTTRIENCEVRGQFDDAVNIHGNFSKVVATHGKHHLRIQTIHPQRFGRNAATPGTGLAVWRHDTLERLMVTRVTDCRTLNKEFCDIRLADPLPDIDTPLVVSRHNPENQVVISGCDFGANRGRGCLVNIEHHVTIENCRFHVSGHAIESVADANYWWEGPPVRDLTIRKNRFDGCGFGPCGSTLIKAGVELPDGADPRAGALRDGGPEATGATRLNRKILGRIAITDNVIDHTAGEAFGIADTESVVLAGNRGIGG